ncbi:GrpB family protein [Nocardia takedensis]
MAAAWVEGGLPPPEPVVLHAYDPRWPEVFADEAERIRQALDGQAIAVEHVGSTAVAGLAAKPTIDIDLIVADPAAETTYLTRLRATGYRLVLREPHWHEHRMLVRHDPTVNLHVFGPDAPEHIRHLVFRDWLRDNPEDRRLYEATELDLAEKTEHAPADYNLAKNTVIDQIYSRAFAAPEFGQE